MAFALSGCEDPPAEITICHCAGGSDRCNTLTVGDGAVAAHLLHHDGDSLGACPAD